jgi:hypothetical protein
MYIARTWENLPIFNYLPFFNYSCVDDSCFSVYVVTEGLVFYWREDAA